MGRKRKIVDGGIAAVIPVQGKKKRSRTSASNTRKKTISWSNVNLKKTTSMKKNGSISSMSPVNMTHLSSNVVEWSGKSSVHQKNENENGDISRLRDERRDLYDLLYGDEAEDVTDRSRSSHSGRVRNEELNDGKYSYLDNPSSLSLSFSSFFGGGENLDDGNLDNFDPYGLEDF